MECASIGQKQHLAINHHEVLGTLNRIPRWFVTLKWDPFIQETPSELVTKIERHSPLHNNVVQMDESLKTLDIDKLFLEHDGG